jgi:hypothetical protein
MIPWDRLDRVLGCQRCSSWYRAERGALVEVASPEASMQVAVRGSFGEWQTHKLRSREWTNSWLRRGVSLGSPFIAWIMSLHWPGRIALGSGLLVALVGGLIALSDSAAAPPPPLKPMPAELLARASLFSEAWLDRDLLTMLKLTDKSFDRQLRQWSGKNPPPATDRSQRKVEAMVSHRESHRATVSVRISTAGPASAKNLALQQQQWTENGSTWSFVPPAAPKPAAPRSPIPRRVR